MNIRRLLAFVTLTLCLLCTSQTIRAQVNLPQKFTFQAIVRDANGDLIRNRVIGLRLTILRTGGASVFQEHHAPTTNDNGLMVVEIGSGDRISGDYRGIAWDNGTYFLQSDFDVSGDNGNYTVTGTQQLLAVPYALHCNECQTLLSVVANGNDADGHQLKRVEDPTDPQDAVTKYYFDSVMASLSSVLDAERRDTIAYGCGSFSWRGTTYDQPGTYIYTIPNAGCLGACDSAIVLHLTMYSGTFNSQNLLNCSGSYTWSTTATTTGNGETYTTSGTYTSNYIDAHGCASVDTLHLTVSTVTHGYVDQTACVCYTWSDGTGDSYTATTVEGSYPAYTITAGNAAGCDSIVYLRLTINQPTVGYDDHTACDSYDWVDGVTYTATTTAPYPTFVVSEGAANGCDSTASLRLTINTNSGITDNQLICNGDALEWYGGSYTAAISDGSVTHPFADANGCIGDSVLVLAVNEPPSVVIESLTSDAVAALCEGESATLTATIASSDGTLTYAWSPATGLSSTNTLVTTATPAATDTYTFTATASRTGCPDATDSKDIMVAVQQCTIYDTIDVTACDSYIWSDGDGLTYTTSGNVKTLYLTSVGGYDSVVTLRLAMGYSSSRLIPVTSCDSYTWDVDGQTYTTSSAHAASVVMTGANVDGCDSTVILSLTINHSSHTASVVSACESYTIGSTTYTESTPIYNIGTTAEGCPDTTEIALTINHATTYTDVRVECDSYTWINGQTYTTNQTTPTYTITGGNAAGCDSVVTLYLTIHASTSSNETVNVCGSLATWNGNTYQASSSGRTYDVVTGVNANGCPSVTHLTVYNRAYTGSNLKFDTVCAGTNSYTWPVAVWADQTTTTQNVTVYSESFESVTTNGNAPNDWSRAKNVSNNSTLTGFGAYSTFGSYVPSAQNGSRFLIDVDQYTNTSGNYPLAGAYTGSFTLTGGSTTVTFYYRHGNISGSSRSTVSVCLMPASSIGSDWTLSSYTRQFLNTTTNSSSWQSSSTTFTSTAGSYALRFLHQGTKNSSTQYAAIDNITVTEQRQVTTSVGHVTDLSSTPNGSNWTSGITTNEYGCPNSGYMIHKRSAGETYTVAACESYTWTNGTTYTSTTSTPTRTYTRSYNGHNCSVTDHLNLTISNPVGNSYTHTSSLQYTWPTSGANGHGSGLNYTASGTYVGPYYMNGTCTVRDTLHLTIEQSCSGIHYDATACETYTWPASGVKGHGTGSSYSANGTYIGPAYSVDVCTNLHDTLTLTITGSVSNDVYVTACDSYTWSANSQTYTSVPGTAPSVTLTSSAGCDSIVTMHLTLNSSSSTNETLNVCGSSASWGGNTYTATSGGATYDVVTSLNGSGCPVTTHLTIYNRSYTGSGLYYDTVCAGTNSFTYRDTLLFEQFNEGVNLNSSGTIGATQWARRQDYTDIQWKQTTRVRNGSTYYYDHTYNSSDQNSGFFGAMSTGGSTDYEASWIWSPEFTIENPANCYFSFWFRLVGYSCGTNCMNYDYFAFYFVPTSNAGSMDEDGVLSFEYGQGNAATSWYNLASALTADRYSGISGTYRLKMIYQDLEGLFAGFDDILLYEDKTVNLSSTPNGSDYTGLVTSTNSYGCPTAGRVIHKLTTGDTYNETACDSYTWINGSTYTFNQTNTAYNHTVHGCSVTDRLNLTVSNDASTTYPQTSSSSYTWPASGANGHGTGQTYTTSGIYYGPFYLNGSCVSQDILNLKVTN